MLDLVTKHGDTTTNLISAPTLLTNSVAHDLTVDTGLQPMVVAPRALPLPANSQEVATSVPQSSTPAPLAQEAETCFSCFAIPPRTGGWGCLTLLSNG